MPLPEDGQPWPTAPFGPYYDQVNVSAAWYANDSAALTKLYTGGGKSAYDQAVFHDGQYVRGGLAGVGRGIRNWFVGQPVTAKPPTRLGTPLPGNLAALSSDLLVAEPPKSRLVIDDNDENAASAVQAVQDDLDLLMNGDEAHTAMSTATEWAAGLGGAAFTWNWDREAADAPWMTAHAADAFIPEFRAGRVYAITVFDRYPAKGDGVYRHLMRHEPGTITHGLYLGKADKLGRLVPFGSKDSPAHLGYLRDPGEGKQFGPEGEVIIQTGIKQSTAAMFVNRRTRRFRSEGGLSLMGRSDYEGIEEFLDAHSETWSSAMRDLRLGRARAMIGASLLEGLQPGSGSYFDEYAEYFTPIPGQLGMDGNLKDQVVTDHPEIRWEAHSGLLRLQVAEILQHGGYSASTYGEDIEGQANVAATNTVDRARKSERTRDQKIRNLKPALSAMSLSGLALKARLYGAPAGYDPNMTVQDLQIVFPEVSQIDPEKQARTLQYLRAAELVSIETGVRERNPEWSIKEVRDEVKRIHEDAEAKRLPDPFGIGAAQPDPTQQEDEQDTGALDEQTGVDQQGGA